MPILETPVYDRLSTELVTFVSDRILPIRGEEGETLPYISWQRIGGPQRAYSHDPYPAGAWVRARMQFSCWATTPLEAITIAEALIAALSGYAGPMGSLNIGSADVALEVDAYEGETKLYRRIVDVIFAYEEGA